MERLNPSIQRQLDLQAGDPIAQLQTPRYIGDVRGPVEFPQTKPYLCNMIDDYSNHPREVAHRKLEDASWNYQPKLNEDLIASYKYKQELEQKSREVASSGAREKQEDMVASFRALIEPAPIVRETQHETVFGGAGNSHFSLVNKKDFHVTTQVPGFGKNEGLENGLSIHDYLSDF